MSVQNTTFDRKLPLFLTFIPAVIEEFSDDELIEVMKDVDCGRLNLSHVTTEDRREQSRDMIERLYRLAPHLKFGMDLQGFETRLVAGASEVINVRVGDQIKLTYDPTGHEINSGRRVYTSQPFLFDFLDKYGFDKATESDRLSVDDLSSVFRFIDYNVERKCVTLEAVIKGEVRPLKSVATTLPIEMPSFSENVKDNDDITWSLQMIEDLGLPHDQVFYCYSFTQNAQNIHDLRERLGNDTLDVWAKIEDRQGVMHLDEISEVSNTLVIARGDGMATLNSNPAASVTELGDKIWEVCERTGRIPVVATANWESSGRDGRPNPMELEYAVSIGRRNPNTIFWSSNVCMKKEFLMPGIRAHRWARGALD